ncbi:thiolase family protein [Chloroflexota bacterium]
MAEKVGIVAVAQTKYEESKPGLRETELVYEVVEKVLQETGLTYAEDGTGIDAAVTCCHDHWDGVTISNWPLADVVGGHGRPEEKVAGDGALAAYYAFVQILSGHFDIVLVTAHVKESQTVKNAIDNFAFDPIYQRMLGLDFLSAAALQANRYMNRYGITPEQCAKVVVKSRSNAKNNPYAQAPMDLSVKEVLNSRMLAYPLRLLNTKPVSDGACAIILAREEKAKRITDKPVWIKGIGSCYDAHYLGDRDLADCLSLVLAAKRAYSMAGIENPRQEIDVAEVCAEYSYQELLWTEGLGFCSQGEGGKLIDAGVTEMGGELPVNPSGGGTLRKSNQCGGVNPGC